MMANIGADTRRSCMVWHFGCSAQHLGLHKTPAQSCSKIFTSFMLKHAPDITRQQIGALWWRADTNNDGQVPSDAKLVIC